MTYSAGIGDVDHPSPFQLESCLLAFASLALTFFVPTGSTHAPKRTEAHRAEKLVGGPSAKPRQNSLSAEASFSHITQTI